MDLIQPPLVAGIYIFCQFLCTHLKKMKRKHTPVYTTRGQMDSQADSRWSRYGRDDVCNVLYVREELSP
jgi:hypothetical protein